VIGTREGAIEWAEQLLGHRQVEPLWLCGKAVVRYATGMTTLRATLYAGYRFPAELISYAASDNKAGG
jgi:hypothetical protein